MITVDSLAAIAYGASTTRVSYFVQPLNDAMAEHAINTPMRQAAFLANVCHESGSFYYLRSITSGEEDEGRADLGNTQPGDGARFIPRGLLKIVGRTVYELCGEELGIDLINQPELLEAHPHSSHSAAWYWSEFKNLNRVADRGAIIHIAERLGNSLTGLVELIRHYDRAKRVLGVKP